jgi:hypothetical protein
MQRHRKEYIVPGPDYIWSLDGHDKLSDWGIEIYAAIDAYPLSNRLPRGA